MFNNKEYKQTEKKPTEINIVAKNTTIKGDILSDGDFRIDGTLEGTLKTKGRVIIGLDGYVKGNVEAVNAEIGGKFSGNLIVNDLLSVKTTGNITGDIVIGKLSVEPGASFNANFSMKGVVKDINQNAQPQEASVSEKTA